MGTDPTKSVTDTTAVSITRRTLRRRTVPVPEHRFAQSDAHRHRHGAPHRRPHHHAAAVHRRCRLPGALRRQTIGDWKMSTIRNQPGRRQSRQRSWFAAARSKSHPGTDLGLLWLTRPTPPRYVLRLQWMMTSPDDNSGVFVAFPHPEQQGYDNTAYVGINFGFEIQIDELARPDNAPIHRTGAIYSFKGPTDGPLMVHPVGEWNQYEITVDGADFTVALNGQVVNRFHFTGDPAVAAARSAIDAANPRFIGLQTHTGQVLVPAHSMEEHCYKPWRTDVCCRSASWARSRRTEPSPSGCGCHGCRLPTATRSP